MNVGRDGVGLAVHFASLSDVRPCPGSWQSKKPGGDQVMRYTRGNVIVDRGRDGQIVIQSRVGDQNSGGDVFPCATFAAQEIQDLELVLRAVLEATTIELAARVSILSLCQTLNVGVCRGEE